MSEEWLSKFGVIAVGGAFLALERLGKRQKESELALGDLGGRCGCGNRT